MRREKELAERRKNEPQLDQNQDHLVRKIFSKFRRDRAPAQTQAIQGSQGQTSPDVERGGEKSDTDGGSTGEGNLIFTFINGNVQVLCKTFFGFLDPPPPS